jgi:NAD(P)-dependent dehydrogenase (short-subunit alcohol dehydrogenase family)
VVSLARSIAAGGRPHGITANVVAPGTIDTPANRAAMPQANPSGWVRPEEVATAIAFLASEQASGVNGSVVELFGH